ncbi:PKD domain-containing protein [Lacibacter sp. H407]|uniref:PKD domain-containing protein n=1 Tax=Lacibacter sp. H407 TaxID=3133423 RepID=UPI0030C068B1
MQKSNLLFLLFFVLLFISCKNEATLPSAVNQSPNAPKAFAGTDIFMIFPVNSCTLKGATYYPQSIQTISWNKIGGTGSFVIENSGSFVTDVRDLETGIHLFELTIISKAGLTGKDTVSVTVFKETKGENELIFEDRQWSCPMGCNIRIENFHSFIPAGTAFKVYVKRDLFTEWVEAMSGSWSKYMWTIYNNGLEILEDQTENPEDTPDVKIVF